MVERSPIGHFWKAGITSLGERAGNWTDGRLFIVDRAVVFGIADAQRQVCFGGEPNRPLSKDRPGIRQQAAVYRRDRQRTRSVKAAARFVLAQIMIQIGSGTPFDPCRFLAASDE